MKVDLIVIGLMISVLVACNAPQQQTVGSLTVQELADRLDGDKDLVVFDVRTQAEVDQGVIHTEALHSDFRKPDFEDRLKELDKTKIYAVYCGSGGRSSNTVAAMKELGFQSIYNIEGGITAWEEAGFPVTNKK